jgi:hypothetical protein
MAFICCSSAFKKQQLSVSGLNCSVRFFTSHSILVNPVIFKSVAYKNMLLNVFTFINSMSEKE